MRLLNGTKMQAAYTQGLRPDARELLVVVLKGTFLIPPPGSPPDAEPQLAPLDTQVPLVMADTFTGEPGLSATIDESDFAYYKPRCDVLLRGSAHAPGGEPTARIPVGLRVGGMHKTFEVLGERLWKKSLFGLSTTSPKPATVIPFSYDTAFGGTDYINPKRRRACMTNTVGRGFARGRNQYIGQPLPNTCEIDKPVTRPGGRHRPMALGPIGRSWEPRLKYAGTYDQAWQDNVFPFLPADFDERYFQCAPPDQQIDHLKGGEEVVLRNLTPSGHAAFKIPKLKMPVTFYPAKGDDVEQQAVPDTLTIEPDAGRFTIVWRAHLPLKKNIVEISEVLAGRMSPAWHRARELGKTWYPSLAALAASQKAKAVEATGDDKEEGYFVDDESEIKEASS